MPITGPRVRELREAADLTREELAVLAKTSYSAIVAYEHDRRNPTADRAERLAAALGVTVDELLKPSQLATDAADLNARSEAAAPVADPSILANVAAIASDPKQAA